MNIIYSNGKDFILDNDLILSSNPLETIFFAENARKIKIMDKSNFAIKIYNHSSNLLAIRYHNYPLVLYGDIELVDELATLLVNQHYIFNKVLAENSLAEAFINAYEKLNGGSHSIGLSMEMMKCNKYIDTNTSGVCWACAADTIEITEMSIAFHKEVLNDTIAFGEALNKVKDSLNDFAILKVDGKIVSMAKKTRETKFLCSISDVYTKKEYRKRGFSKKVVSFLTNHIISNHKIAYLFVDRNNPISNHLYQIIGYDYITKKVELIYNND